MGSVDGWLALPSSTREGTLLEEEDVIGILDDDDLRPTAFDIETFKLVLLLLLLEACDEEEEGIHSSSSLSAAAAAAVATFVSCLEPVVVVFVDDVVDDVDWQVILVQRRKLPRIKYCVSAQKSKRGVKGMS